MSRVVRRLGFSRQKARQVHPQSDAKGTGGIRERGLQAALDGIAAAHPDKRITLLLRRPIAADCRHRCSPGPRRTGREAGDELTRHEFNDLARCPERCGNGTRCYARVAATKI